MTFKIRTNFKPNEHLENLDIMTNLVTDVITIGEEDKKCNLTQLKIDFVF